MNKEDKQKENPQKKEAKVKIAEWFAYAFWLATLILLILVIERFINLF